MLIFSLSFLFGVSQLLWVPTIHLSFIWISLSFFMLVSFGLIKNIINNNKNNSTLLFNWHTLNYNIPIYFIVLLGILSGFCFATLSAYNAKTHQLKSIPLENIKVIGKVIGLPVLTDMGTRGIRTKFSIQVEQSEKFKIKKLLVTWYNNPTTISVGEVWQLNLKLKPIHGFNNLGSFDYSKWLFRHNYDASATVKKGVLIHAYSNDFNTLINQLRAKISVIISQHFTSNRVQSLVKALTIGDKSQISHADSLLFQQTGTAHLIAISGLHIGLIAFVGILFGRILFMLFANQIINRFQYEAIFAILFAAFYALIAGLSIPTIRALVMVIVFSISYAIKLNISRWQAWSFALLIVLIFDPFSVLDIGFWFSFSAVAVLMFGFSGRKNNTYKVMAFIKAQILILIGLTPVMAIVFHNVNLLTPLANLLVLPLASLLLIPLLFASLFVYLFSVQMADFLFIVVEKIALFLFNILDYLQHFHFLTIPVKSLNLYAIVCVIVAVMILLLPRLFRWRFMAVLLLIPLFLKNKNQLSDMEFEVHVLDIGQGLSVLIETRNHSMLYDTGAKYASGFSMANAVVLPYLQAQGIDSLDKLVLSHADNDHAGGASEILSQYPSIKTLDVMGEFGDCFYPKSWVWDKVKFEILSPYNSQPYLGNNSSCVIKISSINGSILLTGDIEDPIEYRLMHSFPEKIKSDVLLVPHHGSRTSSGFEFIKQLNPKIAVNSSGFANQFNHPHPLIKKLYKSQKIPFYDTQESGTIDLKFSHNSLSIQQFTVLYPHFWSTNN